MHFMIKKVHLWSEAVHDEELYGTIYAYSKKNKRRTKICQEYFIMITLP